ncbi:MAG: hypothetical protein WHS83_05710 [Chloroflexus sp.]|uniref:hypothetical protein n=1 Tax=Chloroflexus sp. TaxID=1904827 RepID=UPI00309A13FF
MPTLTQSNNIRYVSDIYVQRLFNLTTIAIFAVIFAMQIYLANLLYNASTVHQWLISEWLINYQGGFVRRGLIGEIIWHVANWLAIDKVLLVLVVQILVLFCFLFVTFFVVKDTPVSMFTALMIFSPAFLLFIVKEWPHVGVRKELFFLLILSVIATVLLRVDKIPVWLPDVTGLAMVATVFIHEMVVIYYFYIIILIGIHQKRLTSVLIKMTLYTLLCFIVFLIVILNRVDDNVIASICQSLQPSPPRDCITGELGATTFLSEDVQFGMQFVQHFTTIETTVVYIVTGILSFFPVVGAIIYYQLWNLLSRYFIILISGLLLASFIMTVILGVIAADYGRFINIHIVSLSILIVFMLKKYHLHKVQRWSTRQFYFGCGIIILWVASWKLPIWLMFATIDNAFPWLRLFNFMSN